MGIYMCMYVTGFALVCAFCIDCKMLISCKIECTVTLFSVHFQRLSFSTFSFHAIIVAGGLWLDFRSGDTGCCWRLVTDRLGCGSGLG